MLLSVVSPVYNEELNIKKFVAQCHGVVSALTNEFEIILVNDCSTDSTKNLLDSLSRHFNGLKIIHLSENVGQHIATAVGLQNARGDYIAMMDSDLQIPPHYIKEFFEFGEKESNWDIISADRKIDARIDAINLILKNISYDKSTQIHSKEIKF